jgi:WD40 repeat protein/tetratricopeptide (TPR) repeat protein
VSQAAFSPDGRFVVTAGGHDIHTGDPKTWQISRTGEGRVWDASTGRPVTPILKQDLILYAVAFSPDGGRVVTGGQDTTAQVWDARTGQPIGPRLRHGSEIDRVAFSTDGRRVITSALDGTAKLWDAATGQAVAPPALQKEGSEEGPGRITAFSPDARFLLTLGKESVGIWDTATGKRAAPPLPTGAKTEKATFGPDGQWVLTVSAAGIRAWHAGTGQPAGPVLKGNTSTDAATLSREGKRLLTYTRQGSARVWDVTTGEPLSPVVRLKGAVNHADFSPDGRLVLTAGQDGTARVWDALTGLPVSQPLPHRAEVHHAAFSPDGRLVVTASQDHTARVWNLAADDRPPDDLLLLAELLSGRHVDASGGLIAVPAAQVRDAWQSLRPRFPADFTTATLPDIWDRREAEACEAADNWAGALLHLDRLLASAPDAGLYARRGHALAELARWDRAAADYEKASQLQPGDRDLAVHHALLCLAAGDRDGYRKGCAALLERFGTTTDPVVANALAWVCVFGWDAVADLGAPVRLAERAVASERSYAYLNTLGSVLCRARRFEEARTTLQEGIRLEGHGGTAWDGFLMVLTEHHLGHRDEARTWLERARKAMDESASGLAWNNRLELRLLRHEAEALLAEPSPESKK